MPDADPEILIQRCLEGALDEAAAAELLELLQRRPELGERLLDHLQLDAMLREIGASSPPAGLSLLPGAAAPAPPRRPRARFSLPTLAGVAALAACLTVAGSWIVHRTWPGEREATTAAVAVLTRGVNLQWEGAAIAPGTPLTPGTLRLKAGLAQIEFFQGARVTLEGPAEFELVSSSAAACRSGKLSAHVPPQAKGFRIDTPRGRIVDLGTDFGLDLTAAAAEVHVFKGEVELHAPDRAMQPLKEGQALALAGRPRARAAEPARFASLQDLGERTAESQRLAFERWLAGSPARNHEAGLLLRLDFQDAASTRTLRNHAAQAADVPDASIVGCHWTEGRWPGKRALEFRTISDRVRLSLPGEQAALTLSAWLRIDGLDRAFNSLFMVEGFKDGALHWQITRDGRLRLGIAGRDGKRHADYDTAAVFQPERFGQWLHLATVYDPQRREVRHYLNGERLARLPVPEVFPLRLGLAELGNWNDTTRPDRVAIRHFSGAMDEFLLHRRALGDAEIAALAR